MTRPARDAPRGADTGVPVRIVSDLGPLARRLGLRALVSTWRGRFILMFVVAQLALPLHYYVARKDLHDERFAWRMFSPMRMTRCTTTALLDSKPLDLSREFHEAWNEIASRGRLGVIEEMGATLCARYSGAEVRITLDCTYLDRPPRSFGGFNLCTVPYF